MARFQRRSVLSITSGLAALVVALGAGVQDAAAVVPLPTGFDLAISPSARLLDALDAKNDGVIDATMFYAIQYDETCDNPHNRIKARSQPALMVTNFADSIAPITSFTLEINGTNDYIFGTGDGGDGFTNFIRNTMYTDPGVSITGSSVSPDNKTLTVTFDGLDAGKMAIFNIDLDTTDPNEFQYPDYRLVLCGTPDHPTTPATTTATFVDATSPAPNSRTLSMEFSQTTEPAYWETTIRPYTTMDKMEYRQMAIPEPSGGVLTLAGLGLLAVRRRRSRVAA